ncbi:unnamed protein product [Echinostoma caproni]|uniref:Origin recognition complex subunit 3 n=1 Tax=Echinostoma caproni TaxID=27848 RepID=A0A183AQL6_9TREM|nr:unnamed protein product [Echinostoma caproni]
MCSSNKRFYIRSLQFDLDDALHPFVRKESPETEGTGVPIPKTRRSLSQPALRHGNPVDSSSPTKTPPSRQLCGRRLTEHPTSRTPRTPSAPRLRQRESPLKQTNHKNKLSHGKPGPLVIILPQVESIPTAILQEFIELTSIYVSEENKLRPHTLPLILVLGLCTSPEISFESRLSASTLARLRIQQFTVPPPTKFLETVLTELIDFPGFRLTYAIQMFLIDSIFLCLDFSVQNFIRRFKFCMLDFYLHCQHPQLLLTPNLARQYLKSLNPTEVANCASMHYPSMSSTVIDSNDAQSIDTSRSPGTHKISIVNHLTHRLEAHWLLAYLAPRVLRSLVTLIQPLPANPVGRSIVDLYRLWLKDGLFNSSAFGTTMNLFQGLSKPCIVSAVDDALSVIRDCVTLSDSDSPYCWPENIVRDGNHSLMEFGRSLRGWREELHAADLTNKTIGSATQPSAPSPLAISGHRKMSLHGLKQHLQEIASSSPSSSRSSRAIPQTEWDRKRLAFVTWLRTELTQLLPTPTSLPLYEVFYGSVVGAHGIAPLRRRLNPPVQRCLHRTLVNPAEYLHVCFLFAKRDSYMYIFTSAKSTSEDTCETHFPSLV